MGNFDFMPDWFPTLNKMVPNAAMLQDDQSRDAVRTAGLLAMANAFANPNVAPGAKPSVMQTITGGLNGFVNGANAAAPQAYEAQSRANIDNYVKNNPNVAQSFGLPAGFPINGSVMQDLAKHYAVAAPTLNGGATGAIVSRIMKDNPGMSFTQAYQLTMGGGLKNGMAMGADGAIAPIPGFAGTAGINKYGEASGGERAKQDYARGIKQQEGLGANDALLQSNITKAAQNANNAESILQEAEKWLPNATGSGAGALLNAGKGFAGVSDQSTQANAALEALGGRLVMMMPRMEGPQSDKDALLYRQMAGRIGDQSIPIADRQAAIQTIRSINEKYTGAGAQPSPADIENAAQSLMNGQQGINIGGGTAPKMLRYNPATGKIE